MDTNKPTQQVRDNLILSGITGSRAYNLDNENSDTDYKAIYVAPTEQVLGLDKPRETLEFKDPDTVIYEVEKYINLALKCNPTVLEMLYLDDYEAGETGQLLIDNRRAFLSNKARKSYGGYAMAQILRLKRNNDTTYAEKPDKYAKHVRHCFRLLLQGRELLTTGNVTVRVSDEMREYLFHLGTLPPAKVWEEFNKENEKFMNAKSILPDEPDRDYVSKLLVKIRKAH